METYGVYTVVSKRCESQVSIPWHGLYTRVSSKVLFNGDVIDGMQFDIIMVDVAAPDPAGDPGTLNSIPAQFLSDHFVVQGLQKRLR